MEPTIGTDPGKWDTTLGKRLKLRLYDNVSHGWEGQRDNLKTLKVRIEDLADALQKIEDAVDREEVAGQSSSGRARIRTAGGKPMSS